MPTPVKVRDCIIKSVKTEEGKKEEKNMIIFNENLNPEDHIDD